MRVCSVRFASVVCPASEAFGFERVTCGFGGGFECGHRFSGASGTFQEVTAGCEQSGAVIVVESIEGGESDIRSVRHADGDGVADSRRRRRPDRQQRRVQGSDLGPVGLLDRRRLGVKGCDRRLKLKRPRRAERAGSIEERDTTIDQLVIPDRAVLIFEEDE
jgi:hypothetical protein